MANINDSEIIRQIVALPGRLALFGFLQLHHDIEDDSTYWQVLGTLWKSCGCTEDLPLWLPLFKSRRRNRNKVMKSGERSAMKRLPRWVKVYRAINEPGEVDTAIAWTLSKDVAQRIFSNGGQRPVIEKVVSRESIFALFTRRGEDEVIINVAG